ncbi:recombinase family protein [Cognatishimia activa]|uniref:recombinase family protein n=1 Tax=Cognatishimia activa TaxID=1715691 RepID=UPI002231A405|nr:recombinase family protein [Cognatishimia activa]UZD92131.1 recombinase family protein [Cognatishimia activa]
MTTNTYSHAVIYCRVSSTKQKMSGGGLESQEHRCRQYALAQGYDVSAVFPDDASGGGDFMRRPGMVALLSFLDAQPDKNYVVIFDDLKRLARDTQFHIGLRQALQARGAKVECLNFKFEDTPEGRFAETIFAAQGELEREQNRRQTIQKMKARVEKGYHVFQAPTGYRYQRTREHGKLLVRAEPVASILQEVLEGYASGRFQSKSEVRRFLEDHPDYPDTKVHPQRIQDFLTRPVYAGMVEAASWDVSLRQGHHEPLVSFNTFQKVQERLFGRAKAPQRVDVSEDFPLRGFVLCAECQKPLTASWSTSKTGKKHPYYWCKTKGCSCHRKSLRRADVEGAFETVVKKLQPSLGFFGICLKMFNDAWGMRHEQAEAKALSAGNKVKSIDGQIEKLVSRIMDSEQPTVIAAYEARIAQLEKDRLILKSQSNNIVETETPLAELFELAFRFLANPWNIWERGDLAARRLVLRLAFQSPISYDREEGIRTPFLALPFKALAGVNMLENGMAHP